MMILNWDLLRKNLLLTHEEGRYPDEGSGPGVVSMESVKVWTKQGEVLLNPIWSKISLTHQKKSLKQALEEVSKQAQEQAPEQFLNLFHQVFKL